MEEPVKSDSRAKRRYDASGRRHAAAATRMRVLDAARDLFVTAGYAATTVATIAQRAGVSPDTVYATVGPKPALFRELIELALSGTDTPIPGAERDYAVQMRAEKDVVAKLAIYAAAITAIQRRLAPLFLALRDASSTDKQLAALWTEISERRASNMRLVAADLAGTGRLRPDLTREEVADIIWVMNSSEFYSQLVQERAWTPERFEAWLVESWCRLLLTAPPPDHPRE